MPTKKRTKRAGTKSSSKKTAKAAKGKRAATKNKKSAAKKKPAKAAKKPAKSATKAGAKKAGAKKAGAKKAGAKKAGAKKASVMKASATKASVTKASVTKASVTKASVTKASAKATPARRAEPAKTAAPAAPSSANGQSRVRATPLVSGPRSDIASRSTRNLRRPDRSGEVPPAPPPNAPPDPAEPDYGEHIFDLRHPHGRRQTDDVGERMAESTLRALTGDHDGDFEESDRISVAETGGPFVETSAEEEFGYGDGGLPEDTEPSALPATNGDDPATPEDALDEDEE